MKERLGSRGFIKGLIFLLLILSLAYVGISFGKPYYRYHTLRTHIVNTLSSGLGNIQSIREKVLEDAKELNIPLEEENLEVSININKVVKVRATWSETVDFFGYYQKTLDFDIEEAY